MKGYFAYRLPHHREVHYLSGEISAKEDLSEVEPNTIVFHSFKGDQIVCLSNYENTVEDQVNIFPSEPFHDKYKKEDYAKSFESIKELIDSGNFEKVVLSRTFVHPCSKSPLAIFNDLNGRYFNTLNYIFSSSITGTWIGASPELLLEKDNTTIRSIALAGTKLPGEQWTNKEYVEHDLVTGHILDVLKDSGCENVVADKKETIDAGQFQHLRTKINAELKNGTVLSDILKSLHPTPAVCGIPKNAAMKCILENEPHDRKFYTGFIGIPEKSQSLYFVNLRCMEWNESHVQLYVGGGLTKDSDLEKEWEETNRKATTLLSAIK